MPCHRHCYIEWPEPFSGENDARGKGAFHGNIIVYRMGVATVHTCWMFVVYCMECLIGRLCKEDTNDSLWQCMKYFIGSWCLFGSSKRDHSQKLFLYQLIPINTAVPILGDCGMVWLKTVKFWHIQMLLINAITTVFPNYSSMNVIEFMSLKSFCASCGDQNFCDANITTLWTTHTGLLTDDVMCQGVGHSHVYNEALL